MKQLLNCLLMTALLAFASHAAEIKLAENGKAMATIVTPAKAKPPVKKAAEDLQKYIQEICGVQLAINADGKPVEGKGLYIGNCKGSPKCTLENAGASLEGYVIEEKDGNLYFLGLNPTPIAYGVYSFLEDDLGVRWYGPGELWEKVPKSAKPGTLAVDVKSRTVIPQTSPRIWSGHHWAQMWKDWNLRNKTNQSEVVSKRNFQNKIHMIFPPEKYGKEHPEYYPLMTNGKRYIPKKGDRDWRPCESNPEVQKIVVDYIRDYFDKNPNQDSFSVGMDDIMNLCSCENCRAMDDAPDSFKHKRFSDRHYKFVNIIAKEVAKTHPGKYIGTLIYSIARQLPKDVPVMEPNVFGYITETSAAWWMPGQMKDDHDLTAEWSRRIKHLSRYDYYGFASMTNRYYPHYVDEQLKFDKSKGMEGMYIETYTFLPLTMPMMWLLAKLEWDASQDADKLLDDFMGIYGAAKPQMARFWDLLEKSYQVNRPGRGRWEHRRIVNQAMASSVEDVEKAFAILDEADKIADSEEVKARIALHRDALKLAAYAIVPYGYNLKIKEIDVKSQADADKVFELADKHWQSKIGRDEYIAQLKKRDDLLGINIRGLSNLRNGEYIQLSAFPALDSAGIPGLLKAISWYATNKPKEMNARIASIDNKDLRELVTVCAGHFSDGKLLQNLIFNGDFEIVGEEKKVHGNMADWVAKGCPKGWNSWKRGDNLKVEVVPEGRTGNAVKVSDCFYGGCLTQTIKVEPGGVYLLSGYMKMIGSCEASLGVRFHGEKGGWRKSKGGDQNMELDPQGKDEWTQIYLLVTVPSDDVSTISIMPGFNKLDSDGSAVLMDDFTFYRLK